MVTVGQEPDTQRICRGAPNVGKDRGRCAADCLPPQDMLWLAQTRQSNWRWAGRGWWGIASFSRSVDDVLGLEVS